VATAEVHYGVARAVASELGMRPLLAYRHLGLGTLYKRTGWPEHARTELSAAIALYRAVQEFCRWVFGIPISCGAIQGIEERAEPYHGE
jgi:hypothetical protein